MGSLNGKVVVVTGAAQGIGEACAYQYAEDGASVVCGDVNAAVRATAATIEAGRGIAVAVVADISTPPGNEQLFVTAAEQFGGVDVFHANAAIQIMGTLEETSADDWDRLHTTNLRGVFLGIQAALPRLRTRGGGSIIITASLLGLVGDPDLGAYGAAKGGLLALSKSIAAAHGPENIRINTICPGDVETPLLGQFFEHQPNPAASRAEITERYPLRRFASPKDVAFVASFLASDRASYLTGIDVVVDGGLLARIY